MAFNMQVTPEILELTQKCIDTSTIDLDLYEENDVKRGLRDVTGRGVLTGLTHISNIVAFDEIDGKRIPREGLLEYRGININDLTDGFISENRFGFEAVAYLLLFGKLPTAEQLGRFNKILAASRRLPDGFFEDMILKAPSKNIMTKL